MLSLIVNTYRLSNYGVKMFRKKLYIFFNSYKSSAMFKPMALVMLFLSIAVAVITCGWGTRVITDGIENSLYYDLSINITKDFKYEDAGELIIKLRDDGLFGVDSEVDIRFDFNDLSIASNKNEISSDMERISAYVVYYGNEYITEQQIINHENVLAISEYLATKLNVGEGDKILFDGKEFTVNKIMLNQRDHINIFLPYTADLDYNKIDLTEEILSSGTYTPTWANFSGLERLMTKSEQTSLAQVGIIAAHRPPIDLAYIPFFIMLILLIAINVINIVVVMNYWLKVNDRKYAVMKITGASPATIASAMSIEAMVAVLLGTGFGILIDYLLTFYVLKTNLSKLLWLNYAMLLPIALLSAIIPLIIKVVKRAKSTVLDRKLYI